MQRVIIVDLSNLRERAPQKARYEIQHVNGKSHKITLAEWSYIYDAITHLAAKAPGSAIYQVADKSTRYHFINKHQGMRIFDANAKLPCDEFWHLYAMRTRKEVGDWLGGGDGEEGVRADELILYLAAQLDGFVVSGDFFREDKYRTLLNQINHRVYWPGRAFDNSDFFFVHSQEIRTIPEGRRHIEMQRLPRIEDAIKDLPLLSAEQIRDIRNTICETGNGLIDRFWLEYRTSYEQKSSSPPERPTTPPLGTPPPPPTKTEPIEPRRVKPIPERRGPAYSKPKPVIRPTPTTSVRDILKENIGFTPPTNDGVSEDAKIPLVLSCNLADFKGRDDAVVRVIGRPRQQDGETFLEWFPGDRRIRIDGRIADELIQPLEFVGLIGRIRQKGGKFSVELSRDGAPKRFEFSDIMEFVSDHISEVSATIPRRWNLPRLPGWRRVVRQPVPGGTGEKTQDLTKKATPEQPERPEASIPLIPLPPEPSRLNARLVTSIAIAAAIATAIVGVVVSLVR
jgi:hypothetical protein